MKAKQAMIRAWEMFKKNNMYGRVMLPFRYFLKKAWAKVKALHKQEEEFESWDFGTM